MNKRKGIRTVTSIMLVFFFFTPVVIRSVHAYTDGSLKRVGLAKTSGIPTKADAQLLFEEEGKGRRRYESIAYTASPYLRNWGFIFSYS